MIYTDPTGHFGVKGALIGGAVGGLFDIGWQLYQGRSMENVDWSQVAGSITAGAIVGGTGGMSLLVSAPASVQAGAIVQGTVKEAIRASQTQTAYSIPSAIEASRQAGFLDGGKTIAGSVGVFAGAGAGKVLRNKIEMLASGTAKQMPAQVALKPNTEITKRGNTLFDLEPVGRNLRQQPQGTSAMMKATTGFLSENLFGESVSRVTQNMTEEFIDRMR
jgi:hypothetical protein